VGRAATSRRGFQQQVDRAVLVLFASVVESLSWATAALLDQDLERAEGLIADDRQIDRRCNELIALIKERLAEQTVGPDELEDLIAILQIVPELERSADLAEHIAQRARRGLGGLITPRSRGLIQSMCDIGVQMWQLAGRAYAERSRDLSIELGDADDELDELSAQLLGEGSGAGQDPAVAAELALIARFYERLGDHAVNLARRVEAMSAPKRLSPIRTLVRRDESADEEAAEGPSEGGWRRVLGRLSSVRLVPVDAGFFHLFETAATYGREAAEELRKMIVAPGAVDDHYHAIRAIERRCDEITVDTLRRLDATFVTPYDREDIHSLAEELDDVVDDVFAAAELIHLVRLTEPLPEVVALADLIAATAEQLEGLIGCLRDRSGARTRLERIESLEREGDSAYRRCIARLFSGEFEALEVLKWKDIVQALENSINQIEDVSNVVETILVKNS
jgi:predicted phosphate transport protein (TIGR00153 family)